MADGLIKKIGKTELYVVQGDITCIPADALMTAINSGGMWFGGIDRAIQRVADDQYHKQAEEAMPLRNLQTIVAKGNRRFHKGQFNDVVFVVDDLESSLDKVAYSGLEAAHREGYGKILVPTIRMGVMAGVVEKTPEEAVRKLGSGISEFMKAYGQQTKLENITFVVYNDMKTLTQLATGFYNNPELN